MNFVATKNKDMKTVFCYSEVLGTLRKADVAAIGEKFGLYVPHSYTKERTVDYVCSFAIENMEYALDVFSLADLKKLKKIVELRPNAGLETKMQKRLSLIQKMGFVVTYTDKSRSLWKFFLPDELRLIIGPCIDGVIAKKNEEKAKLKELDKHEQDFLADIIRQREEAMLPPDLTQQQELTIMVGLDNLPIYRIFKILDSTSFQLLYSLITFLFQWDMMHEHSFSFYRNGEIVQLNNLMRLHQLNLQPGDEIHMRYDINGDDWQHTLMISEVKPCATPPDDYMPEFVTGACGDPGEGSGGNEVIRQKWDSLGLDKQSPSHFVLNDTLQFFWKYKGL